MGPPLAFWHSGGDLIGAQGRVISHADAAALGDLYREEAEAARQAKHASAETLARRLAGQLDAAMDAARRWRRAGAAFHRQRG